MYTSFLFQFDNDLKIDTSSKKVEEKTLRRDFMAKQKKFWTEDDDLKGEEYKFVL